TPRLSCCPHTRAARNAPRSSRHLRPCRRLNPTTTTTTASRRPRPQRPGGCAFHHQRRPPRGKHARRGLFPCLFPPDAASGGGEQRREVTVAMRQNPAFETPHIPGDDVRQRRRHGGLH